MTDDVTSPTSEVYVDPDVASLLAAADPDAKDFWELTPHEARQAMHDMVDTMLAPVEVADVVDVEIPGRSGELRARLYRPLVASVDGLFVFFHGGGWEIGCLEDLDRQIRRLTNDSGCPVLSVDYRLTPEHPFPAGFDDCYDATVWAAAHLDSLGVGRSFFAVGGDSAGGNLAAAVAQASRDRGGPAIDHQLLVYPVVSRRCDTTSYAQFGQGYFLTAPTMRSFWDLYIADDAPPPYSDLYAAGDLSGLPPATVITCGLDPLRDEGIGYAADLIAAGVAATSVHVPGVIHGIWLMDACGRRAYQFGLDVAGALHRAGTTPPVDES